MSKSAITSVTFGAENVLTVCYVYSLGSAV